MCGITGIISIHPIALQAIQTINDVLVHRGPDGAGLMLSAGQERAGDWPGLIHYSPSLSPYVALGHRRLSIVELSALGHQPMVYQDRYVITFNGEIYNHVELRAELEGMGYQFRSHSDTEVILAAYDAWGPDCLPRFNGMWAFAIIDSQEQRVFIARDRFGVKPFYYYQRNGLFVFASEIKAIVAHPEVETAPDLAYARDYLAYGPHEDGARTAFTNILRFPATSYVECPLRALLEQPLTPQVFWSVEPNTSNEAFDEATASRLAQQYYDLLEDAVRLRLRADVKVGSALSGGLDSSSIVYLINKLLKEQGREELQETFSCVYLSPGTEHCDESEHINNLAQALGVHSNQIEPSEKDIPAENDKMIYAMDYPPESTCMSGWHTFKRVAASDVTVTLDGQGADEQLAGYLNYWMYWFAQMPLWRALTTWPTVRAVPGATHIALRGVVLNLCRHLIGKRLSLALLHSLGYRTDPFVPLNTVLHHARQHGLATLIHYSDVVSMAWSIESRMPFMDYRLVEFLASVPAAYKLHQGWTKYLSRLAFAGKLPDEIVWRKDKMGWPIPEDHWFGGRHKEWMDRQMARPIFLQWFEQASTAQALHGAHTLTKRIRVLNLSSWYCQFFGDKGTVREAHASAQEITSRA